MTAGHSPVTIAVTGTNGKTSVVEFIRQLACSRGHEAISVGTLGERSCAWAAPRPWMVSRPGLWSQEIARYRDEGAAAIAIEAHSVSLAAGEWTGAPVDVAVLTSMDADHLDHHGGWDAYVAAKLRLFSEVLRPGGVIVAPGGSPLVGNLSTVAARRQLRLVLLGEAGGVGVSSAAGQAGDGYEVTVRLPEGLSVGTSSVVARLPNRTGFLVEALGLAVAALHAAGIDLEIAEPIELEVPAGRMQRVSPADAPAVFIDYAHTPGALRTVLREARADNPGRLRLVLGCGGDRDRSKRAAIGAVASEVADDVIVTDDNPRSEDPGTIRAEILGACPGARDIADRREAISAGLTDLRHGDVLLIVGKGHEAEQQYQGTSRPFSDEGVVRQVMAAPGARRG